MKKRTFVFAVLFLLPALIFVSCSSSSVYKEAYPLLIDGRYDSEFPYKSCSDQLEEISESIKFINTIAYYKVYFINEKYKIKKGELTDSLMELTSTHEGSTEKTAAGTGLVFYNENGKVALLTCAHVVSFDDTLYSYSSDSLGNYTSFINGLLVKQRQDIFVPDLPEGGHLDILEMDKELDVAILGKKFEREIILPVSKFTYPFGKARELDWGSFVYILGYPMGYKTLTKALVSSPNRDKTGSFILDANFNEGFSGGIILAIRDGVPNFEMVGMIKTIFADYEYVLRPSKEFNYNKHNPLVPYSGETFVDRRVNIKYGIARAVPIESIMDFIYRCRTSLNQKGWDFENIYSKFYNF
ncbi:MAG: serine protease [Ignavibacteriales bacterium]|nr:MAG: serine protease [Ignavibacteriales bacterium]